MKQIQIRRSRNLPTIVISFCRLSSAFPDRSVRTIPRNKHIVSFNATCSPGSTRESRVTSVPSNMDTANQTCCTERPKPLTPTSVVPASGSWSPTSAITPRAGPVHGASEQHGSARHRCEYDELEDILDAPNVGTNVMYGVLHYDPEERLAQERRIADYRRFVEAERRAELSGFDDWLDPPGPPDGTNRSVVGNVPTSAAPSFVSDECQDVTTGTERATELQPDANGASRAPAARRAINQSEAADPHLCTTDAAVADEQPAEAYVTERDPPTEPTYETTRAIAGAPARTSGENQVAPEPPKLGPCSQSMISGGDENDMVPPIPSENDRKRPVVVGVCNQQNAPYLTVCDVASSNETLTDRDAAECSALSCLLYTSPSPRDLSTSRMPSSA